MRPRPSFPFRSTQIAARARYAQLRGTRFESPPQTVTLKGSTPRVHVTTGRSMHMWLDLPQQPKLEAQPFTAFVYAELPSGSACVA
jgi:hypothetical protein